MASAKLGARPAVPLLATETPETGQNVSAAWHGKPPFAPPIGPHSKNQFSRRLRKVVTGAKKTVARPQQFSAVSGQDSEVIPAGGTRSGGLSSSFLRLPSPHRLLLACPPPSREWERDQKPRQRLHPTSATVTVLAFAVWFKRFARRSLSPPTVKRAAYGRVTDSGFKNQANGICEALRESRFSHGSVLKLSGQRLPNQYELAEVVGKWVWLDVSPAKKPNLAGLLWPLGFHWNQRRGVWQHPCGKFDPFGSHPTDPRAKYRTYFPADVLPA